MTQRQLASDEYEALRMAAQQVLTTNQIQGWNPKFSSTVPATGQYPHQWNWDSAFIAIGLACIDEKRARMEIQGLLAGQWKNGMIPQIIYNPDETKDRTYFPNRHRWGIGVVNPEDGPVSGEKQAFDATQLLVAGDAGRTSVISEREFVADMLSDHPVAKSTVQTSGITQPPVAAIAVEYIHQKSHDRNASRTFLEEVYPKLLKYHEFLLTKRDPLNEGLAFLIHPWESGLDNSPRWQPAIDSIKVDLDKLPPYERLDTRLVATEQRPKREDYERYIHLIEVYKAYRYDQQALFENCPFVVQDVLFNSILHRANEALLKIAKELNKPCDKIEEWTNRTKYSFASKLWNEELGRYLDYDLAEGRLLAEKLKAIKAPHSDQLARRLQAGIPIDQNTIATFIPLFAELATKEQAERLVKGHLRNTKEYWPAEGSPQIMVPTTSKDNKYWSPERYWRGPVWINTNWMVIQGLKRYGYHEEANRIKQDTLSLFRNPMPDGRPWWFWEYFNPLNGNVYGIDNFSWSAALAIELTQDTAQSG